MLIYSFDCAQHNMGFTAIKYNQIQPLPDGTRNIEWLEHAVQIFVNNTNIIEIVDARLVDLGDNEITGLRRFLDNLPMPDKVVIEFQMNLNDTSRRISHMIAYHYAFLPQVNIGGAEKNKLTLIRNIDKDTFDKMLPRLSKSRKKTDNKLQTISEMLFNNRSTCSLSHRDFLRITNKNYDGNKLHTTAMFEFWLSAFGLKYEFKKYDDVADSFIQCLVVLHRLNC